MASLSKKKGSSLKTILFYLAFLAVLVTIAALASTWGVRWARTTEGFYSNDADAIPDAVDNTPPPPPPEVESPPPPPPPSPTSRDLVPPPTLLSPPPPPITIHNTNNNNTNTTTRPSSSYDPYYDDDYERRRRHRVYYGVYDDAWYNLASWFYGDPYRRPNPWFSQQQPLQTSVGPSTSTESNVVQQQQHLTFLMAIAAVMATVTAVTAVIVAVRLRR